MPEYSVRLVLRVAAESPDKAAPTFITHLVENGMTDWVYQVCDPDDDMKVIGYFDGFGLPVEVDALAKPEAPAVPAPAEQTPVQTETDGELLSLAQELNEEDRPTEAPTEPLPQPQE